MSLRESISHLLLEKSNLGISVGAKILALRNGVRNGGQKDRTFALGSMDLS